MAATGIVVDDAVVAEFNEVKLGRVKAKFLIYKIDDTKIVKETMSSATATFNDLRECRNTTKYLFQFEQFQSPSILPTDHFSIPFFLLQCCSGSAACG